jgi:hypothetical protein
MHGPGSPASTQQTRAVEEMPSVTPQLGNLLPHHVPHELSVHTEVAVDQPVPPPGAQPQTSSRRCAGIRRTSGT